MSRIDQFHDLVSQGYRYNTSTNLSINNTGFGASGCSSSGSIWNNVLSTLLGVGMTVGMGAVQNSAASGAQGTQAGQGKNTFMQQLGQLPAASASFQMSLTSYNQASDKLASLQKRYEASSDDNFTKKQAEIKAEIDKLDSDNGCSGNTSENVNAYKEAVANRDKLQAQMDKAKPLYDKFKGMSKPVETSFTTSAGKTITFNPDTYNNNDVTQDKFTINKAGQSGENPETIFDEVGFNKAKEQQRQFNAEVKAYKEAEDAVEQALSEQAGDTIEAKFANLTNNLASVNRTVEDLGGKNTTTSPQTNGLTCKQYVAKKAELQKELDQLNSDNENKEKLKNELAAQQKVVDSAKEQLLKQAASLKGALSQLTTVRDQIQQAMNDARLAENAKEVHKNLRKTKADENGSATGGTRNFFSRALGKHRVSGLNEARRNRREAAATAEASRTSFQNTYGMDASQTSLNSVNNAINQIQQLLAKLPAGVDVS